MHTVKKRTERILMKEWQLHQPQTDGFTLWPELVEREYAYFCKTKRCLRVDEFNHIFNLEGTSAFRSDCAPVFFAGNVKQSPFCFLGLNPAYKEVYYDKERKVLCEKGWEWTYLNFFAWAPRVGIKSQYHSRFAVFLAGLLGAEKYPDEREQRFQLLHQNVVNLNVSPYHSEEWRLNENLTESQRELIMPYLKTLEELVNLLPRKVVVMTGKDYEYVQKEVEFKESWAFKVNERLQAHVGKCFSIDAVWLDRFIVRGAGVTNEQLFNAGKKIKNDLEF